MAWEDKHSSLFAKANSEEEKSVETLIAGRQGTWTTIQFNSGKNEATPSPGIQQGSLFC
jgi:hypothetical protein